MYNTNSLHHQLANIQNVFKITSGFAAYQYKHRKDVYIYIYNVTFYQPTCGHTEC